MNEQKGGICIWEALPTAGICRSCSDDANKRTCHLALAKDKKTHITLAKRKKKEPTWMLALQFGALFAEVRGLLYVY